MARAEIGARCLRRGLLMLPEAGSRWLVQIRWRTWLHTTDRISESH